MKILALDSCTDVCSVCIIDNSIVISEHVSKSSRTHSERLMPAITNLFSNIPWTPRELDAVAVINGPGSFTGLRIALSVAKGLAFGSKKPIVAMNALEVAAAQVKVDGLICPVMDARRGEIFTVLFERKGEQLIPQTEPRSIRPDEWKELLPNQPVYFCGPGLYLYQELLQNNSGSKFSAEDFVLAKTLAFESEKKIAKGETVSGTGLHAVYLRPSDAETKGPKPRKKLEHIP